MQKWESISLDEKETLLCVDYFEKTFNFYTTNQSTGNRLKKRIGTPSKIQTNEGKVFSMEWRIPFHNREDIKKALSINVLVSHYQSEATKEDKCETIKSN